MYHWVLSFIPTFGDSCFATLGPTHQPVELSSYVRSLPNFQLIRPADAEEVIGAWQLAHSDDNAETPSLFALSRQAIP